MNQIVGYDLYGPVNQFLSTNLTLSNLHLKPGYRYYATVTAFNRINMHTTATSDGLIIDNEAPKFGVVHATLIFDGIAKKTFGIVANWHGFSDVHSHIKYYSISLQRENGTIEDDFRNVGILTSFRYNSAKLEDGEKYIISVKATDSAGHESIVVKSTPLWYDISPPEGLTCSEYVAGENYLLTCVPCNESSSSCTEASAVCSPQTNVVLRKHILHKFVISANKCNVSEDLVARLNIDKHWEWITMHGISDVIVTHETTYIPVENSTSPPMIYIYRGYMNQSYLRVDSCIKQNFATSDVISCRQSSSPRLITVSWNIVDRFSGIQSYQLGIGTNAGGFQLMKLSEVGNVMSTTIPLAIYHKSPIYVTLIAEDMKGNTKNFSGKSTILWSGPKIYNLTVKYNCTTDSSCSLQANWIVNVADDLVSFCSWSIGRPFIIIQL